MIFPLLSGARKEMTNKLSATLIAPPYDHANVLPEVRQHHHTNDALDRPQSDILKMSQATEDKMEEIRIDEPKVWVNEKSTDQASPVINSGNVPRYPPRER